MAFTDFIQLQRDIAHALLSDAWLANVNVVTREEVIETGSKLEDENLEAESLVYTKERNGKSGCGIIVEKPEMATITPNVPGPQGDILVVCLVLEDWTENYGPSGTNLPADQVGQKILDIGHHFVIEGLGPLRSDEAGLISDRSWEPLRAYKARLRINANRTQTPRVERVTITIAEDGTFALSTPTAGAAIYFTTDGSTPAASNVSATLYDPENPNLVATDTGVMRAAAFKTGMVQSAIAKKSWSI